MGMGACEQWDSRGLLADVARLVFIMVCGGVHRTKFGRDQQEKKREIRGSWRAAPPPRPRLVTLLTPVGRIGGCDTFSGLSRRTKTQPNQAYFSFEPLGRFWFFFGDFEVFLKKV